MRAKGRRNMLTFPPALDCLSKRELFCKGTEIMEETIRKFDLNIERVLEHWTIAHALREVIANALDEAALSAFALYFHSTPAMGSVLFPFADMSLCLFRQVFDDLR